MIRILTYIKYELKVFLGNYFNMFWMMGFPLVLLTIFTIFFAQLRFREIEVEKVTIAYHENAFIPLSFVDEPKKRPDFDTLDRSSIETRLFEGVMLEKDQGLEELGNNRIDAYVDKDLNLFINKNGIGQLIMDEVLTTTKQISSLWLPFDAYDFERTYVKSSDEKQSPIDVIFYALFSMISLYGAYLSSTIGNRLIAGRQTVALRNASSPTSKAWQVMISVVTSYLWSLFLVAVIVVYLEFILKQHFFSPDLNNIPLVLAALTFGIAWGLFLGTVIEKESLQTAATISSLLILSGISGLYSHGIRLIIKRSFPLLLKLNPVSLISDELLKVNMLGNYSTLKGSILLLTGYSIVLVIVSILHIRRKKA